MDGCVSIGSFLYSTNVTLLKPSYSEQLSSVRGRSMARFISSSRRSLPSYCKTLISPFRQQRHHLVARQTNRPISNFLAAQIRTLTSESPPKSPFESNILRILRNEIEYQSEYAPPHQPVTEFNAFTVEDHPGEQFITLKSKFGEDENIKIEATMFDGFVLVPKSGESDDNTEENVRLHINLLVDISKGEGYDFLEFVCSAWPDSLEIQKVYLLRCNGAVPQPYMGPNFRDLDKKLQSALFEFLKERGVNDDLSVFLHQYMTNKDRIELIQWLGNVKSFVEK